MDQPMVDTQITGTQLEKWLADYFKQPLKLKSCQPKKIAAGEGFTSTILRVAVEYENGQPSYPKSVIVKTPSLPAIEDLMKKLTAGNEFNVDETIDFTTKGHNIECEAYRAFEKDPPIPLPIIYAATECHKDKMGAIVMEDFGDRAAIIGDPISTLSLDQLYAAADAVADWHAWCYTTDTDWQSRFEPADSDRRKELFAGWFDMMKNCFERVKVKYPNVFSKLSDELVKHSMDMSEFSRVVQKHRSIIPDVVVHGDFYANNLMYETSKDQTGKITVGSKLLCIIDWALAHSGCGLEDFGRLLVMSVDTETRRKHSEDVLRRYYDRLVKKAGIEKVKASFEQLLQVYEDHFIFSGMFFVLMLDWLQNLFVRVEGDEGERKRQILYERCKAAYDDIMPLIEKAAAAAMANAKP